LAIFNAEGALHLRGQIRGVGDEKEGHFFFAVEFEEKAGKGFGGGAVEGAGGFVGEEKAGLIDEGANDGDALTFAAGKLAGAVIEALAEADAVKESLSAFGSVVAHGAFGENEGWDKDIFQRGALREEVVRLKNETEAAVAKFGEGLFVEGGEIGVVDEDAAGGGPVEGADDVEEGALAGAGRSDDGGGLSLLDFEVDVAQDGDGRRVEDSVK
jgi:hypothetical protein